MMKRFKILLLFLFPLSIVAQQVSEGAKKMTLGDQSGLHVIIKKTEAEDIEEAWIKYIKDYKGKTKKNKKTGEVFSDNAEIEAISANSIDIYTTTVQNGEDTELSVWFNLGGAFLNSNQHAVGYAEAVKLLEDFVLANSAASLEEMVSVEEKQLKKLEGEMKDLKKEKENYEEEIAKCEKKIEESKKGIEQNAVSQREKTTEMETQKQTIERLRSKLQEIQPAKK